MVCTPRDLVQREPVAGPRRPGRRGPAVLIVDDTGLILVLLKVELESWGCEVFLASSGEEAVALFQEHEGEIDFALLDVQMPGLDGPQTLEALRSLDPQLRCCFMTGGPGRYTEQELLGRGAERVLYKPFRPAEVAEVVWQLTGLRTPTSQQCRRSNP